MCCLEQTEEEGFLREHGEGNEGFWTVGERQLFAIINQYLITALYIYL